MRRGRASKPRGNRPARLATTQRRARPALPSGSWLHDVLRKAEIKHVYNEVKDGKHDLAFFTPSLRRGAKFLSEQVVKAREK